MPCYLFTYHAYGTWLPDHQRGYVKRKQGIQPTNLKLAANYRSNMSETTTCLLAAEQKLAIEALVSAMPHIECRLHYVATDLTHIHVLVSWQNEVTWQQRRTSLKKAVTIHLKKFRGRRTWLSEGSSRKQVRNYDHYQYLLASYLPRHRGLKWSPELGIYA